MEVFWNSSNIWFEHKYTKILWRNLMPVFGHFFFYFQKISWSILCTNRSNSSNLRNHHHRLSFFYFNHHPRYGMPALPGTIAWDATSNLGFHYLSSISLLLCHKAILSWLHGWPMSLGWLIVLYLDKTTTKHEEIYLEWSRFPYCLGHFSVLLDKGSLEETFVFPFFPITATWLLLGHLLTLYKGDWSLFPS